MSGYSCKCGRSYSTYTLRLPVFPVKICGDCLTEESCNIPAMAPPSTRATTIKPLKKPLKMSGKPVPRKEK